MSMAMKTIASSRSSTARVGLKDCDSIYAFLFFLIDDHQQAGCIARMFARHIRRTSLASLVATLTLAVGSILAAPEGAKELVPKSIVGMTMRYSDLHGHYTVILKNDASYSFTTTRE